MHFNGKKIEYGFKDTVTTGTDLVAAQGAGRRIVLLSIVVTIDADGTFKLMSNGASDTQISAAHPALDSQAQGISSQHGFCETLPNEALQLICTGGNGFATYSYIIEESP